MRTLDLDKVFQGIKDLCKMAPSQTSCEEKVKEIADMIKNNQPEEACQKIGLCGGPSAFPMPWDLI